MKRLPELLLAIGLLLPFGDPVAAQTRPVPAATSPAGQQLLEPEQLDQILAPVALYPDALLSEVMMASTYPLEVVQADRWAGANKNLKGEALAKAAEAQGWDKSVVSLVATPSVLSMMSAKLDWTQKLGDAVLAQQTDVMDSVQRLRAKAQAQNKLTSTKEQKVTVTTQANKQVIAIEPAEPNTIYVPYYDPAVVYGGWPYPAYPPYAFPYGGYVAGAAIATGIAFGTGVAVGVWAANHNWGGGFNWGNNNINVNRNVNINNTNINNWAHNPDHRHGVRYNNANVQQRFANRTADRGGAQNRLDFRGHDGKAALNPSGDRSRPGTMGSGTRDRTNAGQRGGERKNVGTRGSGQRNAAARGAGQRSAAARGSGGREHAFSNSGSGRNAFAQAQRGHASLGGHASFASHAGGGGMRAGGGGGFRGGGGRGGGGRRSDIRLKHDIALLGWLDNGLGFYRFAYNGSDKAYIGVMAQEVQAIVPDAVVYGRDGFLRVLYGKLGLKFESYEQWISSGGRIPSAAAAGTSGNGGNP